MLYRFSVNDLWLRVTEMKYTTLKKKRHIFYKKVTVLIFVQKFDNGSSSLFPSEKINAKICYSS